MFDDIRPYNDAEVRSVLRKTVANRELLAAIRTMVFPNWPRFLEPMISLYLRWQVRNVDSVASFQHVVERYLLHMMDSTMDGFTVSGLDNIPRDRACVFIGNHRDIVLDPAFMNLALHRNDLETCRIAIGDNLLSKDYVADLMRLNKSFIVKRSAKGPRQLLQAYRQLSDYIAHSVLESHCNVWIAQREGRAKDGNDRTEPAIIKMLYMHGKQSGLRLSEYLSKLPLVPVSISYEYDPCDQLKAGELEALDKTGAYTKAENEDIESIAAGVRGWKGKVHLAFCPPVNATVESAEQAAVEIDQHLHRNYRLHASNLCAYQQQKHTVPLALLKELLPDNASEGRVLEEECACFLEHLQQVPTVLQDRVVSMYARPVHNRLVLEGW